MKKIISYSLFGDDDYYLKGAVINAEMVGDIFPGWKCRFYVDENVNNYYIKKLKELNSEVIIMRRRSKSKYEPLTWRFRAAIDADIMISRDTDSFLLKRDKIAVDEWLNSNKNFHIIRDYSTISPRISAGLWGCRNGILKNMGKFLDDWEFFYFRDNQIFLSIVILPLIKNDVFIHDQYGKTFSDEITHKIKCDYDYHNYIGKKM